jgi:DnaJ-class molecular chaperone
MATDEERRDEWRRDAKAERGCSECNGRGYLTVELDGGGPAYHCPDCGGTGEGDE